MPTAEAESPPISKNRVDGFRPTRVYNALLSRASGFRKMNAHAPNWIKPSPNRIRSGSIRLIVNVTTTPTAAKNTIAMT